MFIFGERVFILVNFGCPEYLLPTQQQEFFSNLLSAAGVRLGWCAAGWCVAGSVVGPDIGSFAATRAKVADARLLEGASALPSAFARNFFESPLISALKRAHLDARSSTRPDSRLFMARMVEQGRRCLVRSVTLTRGTPGVGTSVPSAIVGKHPTYYE